MRPTLARLSALAVLLLAAVALAGCAGAQQAPTPTMTPLPTTTPWPSPTPWPTRTPTAVPTTATPSPTPSEATSLLRQASGKQQTTKSFRGQMEIKAQGFEAGLAQSFTMGFDMEVAEPDAHMKMYTKGLPLSLDMEIITKGDTMYMKMGDEWASFPGEEGQGKAQMEVIDTDELEQFLDDASGAKIIGRRQVKGIECDIVSFTLSAAKMRELMAMSGQGRSARQLPEDVEFEQFQGEFAIGVADKLMRQMVIKMSGFQKSAPADKFAMEISMTIWDINAPIVIKAPEGAKPFAAATPGLLRQ